MLNHSMENKHAANGLLKLACGHFKNYCSGCSKHAWLLGQVLLLATFSISEPLGQTTTSHSTLHFIGSSSNTPASVKSINKR